MSEYIEKYTPLDPRDFDEWHEPVTISYGELYEWGFIDWNDESWNWDYYDLEQKERLQTKITNHFYDRDIAIVPPGAWKREFLRKLNEIMPKYKIIYKWLDDGNVFQKESEYGKSRNIFSEYPDTMLSGNSDYASNGNDKQYEKITEGDFLDKYNDIINNYKDPDLAIIDELDSIFSSLFSISINGF